MCLSSFVSSFAWTLAFFFIFLNKIHFQSVIFHHTSCGCLVCLRFDNISGHSASPIAVATLQCHLHTVAPHVMFNTQLVVHWLPILEAAAKTTLYSTWLAMKTVVNVPCLQLVIPLPSKPVLQSPPGESVELAINPPHLRMKVIVAYIAMRSAVQTPPISLKLVRAICPVLILNHLEQLDLLTALPPHPNLLLWLLTNYPIHF